MALDPEVRRAFEAAGERAIRASLNRKHPVVREWLQEKEAARARKMRLSRNIVRSSVAVVFVVLAAAVLLLAKSGDVENAPNVTESAEATLPSFPNPDSSH
jgi:predicted translin family RNA/ssDNA-binding protein